MKRLPTKFINMRTLLLLVFSAAWLLVGHMVIPSAASASERTDAGDGAVSAVVAQGPDTAVLVLLATGSVGLWLHWRGRRRRRAEA